MNPCRRIWMGLFQAGACEAYPTRAMQCRMPPPECAHCSPRSLAWTATIFINIRVAAATGNIRAAAIPSLTRRSSDRFAQYRKNVRTQIYGELGRIYQPFVGHESKEQDWGHHSV